MSAALILHCFPQDAAKLKELQSRVANMRKRLHTLDQDAHSMFGEFQNRGHGIIADLIEGHHATYDAELAGVHALFDATGRQLNDIEVCHGDTRERVTEMDRYFTLVFGGTSNGGGNATQLLPGGTLTVQEAKERELQAKYQTLIDRFGEDEESYTTCTTEKIAMMELSIDDTVSTHQSQRAAESQQLLQMLDEADGQLASWQHKQLEADTKYTELVKWREQYHFNTWM